MSSSEASGLPCPKCTTPMGNETHLGVEIDRCPDCKGLFFDAGELERVLAAHGGAGIDEAGLSKVASDHDLAPANCPRCEQPMTAGSGPAKRMRVDRCDGCGATFLDQGELSTIQLWKTLTGG
jgi:Zn-finger nucleic acid-binding protein